MTEAHLIGDRFIHSYDKQSNGQGQNTQQPQQSQNFQPQQPQPQPQQQQQQQQAAHPQVANAFSKESLGNIRSNSAPPVDAGVGGATPPEENDPESFRYDLKYAEYYYAQKPLDPRLPPPLVNWKHTLWDRESRGEENNSVSQQIAQPSPKRPSKGGTQNSQAKSSPWAIPTSKKTGLVNRIQEDFPRTPSPVYNQNQHSLFSRNETPEMSSQNVQSPLGSSPHSPQQPQVQPQAQSQPQSQPQPHPQPQPQPQSQPQPQPQPQPQQIQQPQQHPSRVQHPIVAPGSPKNQNNQQSPTQQQQQPPMSPMFFPDSPNNVDNVAVQIQNMSLENQERPPQFAMSTQQMTPQSGASGDMKEYDPMIGIPTTQYMEYQQPPEVMSPYGPYAAAYNPNIYQHQLYAAGPQYGMVNPMVGFGPAGIKDGRKFPYYQPGAYDENYGPYGPPPPGRNQPPYRGNHRHPHHGKGGRDHHHHHHPDNRRRPRKKHLEREDAIPRSKLMEEFRSTKSKKWELEDIKNHIVEFSRDQHGSRFIQQKLENATDDDKELVFSEVYSQALELMTDVFGNYVIQKLFEHGLPEHRRALANVLKGNVLNLTLQTYGCRVIQKALEVMDENEHEIVAQELEGHVVKCVEDQNGNHVIQKCIEQVNSSRVQFIVDAFDGAIHEQGVHAYGCRVIQRILEYCTNSQTKPILEEILREANNLIRDQYGNYVVQHVLQNGQPHSKSNIIAKMHGQLLELSQHKFASNVIERCFQVANKDERQKMIDECLEPRSPDDPASAPLFKMMKDQYANYVVQKFIDMADEKQRHQIIDSIRPHVASLKKFTYGKHIIARLGMA